MSSRAARFHILALAILILPAAAEAQTRHRRQALAKTALDYTIASGASEVTVPFELANNHLIIPVSVNGSETFRVILDTGMPTGGIFLYGTERVQELGMAYGDMRVQVGGVGGNGKTRTAQIAQGLTLRVGGLEMRQRNAIVSDPVDHFTPYHDGIIGAVLFENFIVHIDYDSMRLRIREPKGFVPPQGASEIPLAIRGRMPYVKGTVSVNQGQPIPVEMVLDLGASHAISLNQDSADGLVPPPGALETVIGRGLIGSVTGQVTRIDSLQLGDQELRNVLATFPDNRYLPTISQGSRNGNLGNGTMKRFHVTFDYGKERLFLQPNDSFKEPFEYDMSGIRLREDRHRPFWIEELLPRSPGLDAGLQVDDILVDVNGRAAEEMGLEEIKELFKREGEEVDLVFQRGNERITVKIKLRRLV
jgi:predicted aspartyl protease